MSVPPIRVVAMAILKQSFVASYDQMDWHITIQQRGALTVVFKDANVREGWARPSPTSGRGQYDLLNNFFNIYTLFLKAMFKV